MVKKSGVKLQGQIQRQPTHDSDKHEQEQSGSKDARFDHRDVGFIRAIYNCSRKEINKKVTMTSKDLPEVLPGSQESSAKLRIDSPYIDRCESNKTKLRAVVEGSRKAIQMRSAIQAFRALQAGTGSLHDVAFLLGLFKDDAEDMWENLLATVRAMFPNDEGYQTQFMKDFREQIDQLTRTRHSQAGVEAAKVEPARTEAASWTPGSGEELAVQKDKRFTIKWGASRRAAIKMDDPVSPRRLGIVGSPFVRGRASVWGQASRFEAIHRDSRDFGGEEDFLVGKHRRSIAPSRRSIGLNRRSIAPSRRSVNFMSIGSADSMGGDQLGVFPMGRGLSSPHGLSSVQDLAGRQSIKRHAGFCVEELIYDDGVVREASGLNSPHDHAVSLAGRQHINLQVGFEGMFGEGSAVNAELEMMKNEMIKSEVISVRTGGAARRELSLLNGGGAPRRSVARDAALEDGIDMLTDGADGDRSSDENTKRSASCPAQARNRSGVAHSGLSDVGDRHGRRGQALHLYSGMVDDADHDGIGDGSADGRAYLKICHQMNQKSAITKMSQSASRLGKSHKGSAKRGSSLPTIGTFDANGMRDDGNGSRMYGFPLSHAAVVEHSDNDTCDQFAVIAGSFDGLPTPMHSLHSMSCSSLGSLSESMTKATGLPVTTAPSGRRRPKSAAQLHPAMSLQAICAPVHGAPPGKNQRPATR